MRESRPELFRRRHFPDKIIVLCVRWYLRYPLSYRDLEEMMAEPGLTVDNSTAARWVLRYAPVLTSGFGPKCGIRTARGASTKRTSVLLGGGQSLSRPSTQPAAPSSSSLSPYRDAVVAKTFLQLAMAQAGHIHARVSNVDGHSAYPAAVAELKRCAELGRHCDCRRSPYMNNILEQDHLYVKKRVAASP